MSTTTADDGVCAICLKEPHPLDVAFVKRCLHAFCAPCVARWSTFTPTTERYTRCPCCKAPFDTVLVYRALNGEAIEGELMEESLCLLNRATWVLERRSAERDDERHLRERSSEDDEEDFLDDDVRLSTRGTRKIIIGNRRFGRGGFVNAGRLYARPVAGKAKQGGKGKDVAGSSATSSASSASASTCSSGKPPKGASAASAVNTSLPVNIPSSRRSRADATGASPNARGGGEGGGGGGATSSEESEFDASPRDRSSSARGKKSAKRQESLAKKREKEQSKAASRLKRREEEQAAEAAKKAAKALEALALQSADDADASAARACVVGE